MYWGFDGLRCLRFTILLVADSCAKARATLPSIVASLKQLQTMVPREDYFKYGTK